MERRVREDDSITPESPGQLRSHPAHNVLRAHGARLTCNLMSPPEQNQGWNAANTELGGQVMELLLSYICGEPDNRADIVVKPELVVRGSAP